MTKTKGRESGPNKQNQDTSTPQIQEEVEKEKVALELINQGKINEAEKIYRELINRGSKNHICYGNLAAICWIRKEKAEMIKLLNKALEINPNFPEAHNNLGNALKSQGDLKAAITSYRKALQFNKNYSEAYSNLGIALNELGDINAAIKSLQ